MHFNKQNKKVRKVHNRIYSAALVFALAASLAAGAVSVSPTDTYAKTAKQKRDEAKKNLSDTNSKIDNIKDNQADIKSDISQASKNLKNLMSKKQPVLPSRTGSIVKYAILYMNKNLSKKISRNTLADQVGVDPDYLTRTFHKEMGIGISAYLNLFRLEESHKLLSLTGMKIQDIAKECGFSNPAYFINSYRARFGISPGTVRKEGLSPVNAF